MPSPPLAHAPLDAKKTLMFSEAAEGGAAVQRFLSHNKAALARLGAHLKANAPRSVTTVARGSSDHAATYGKYLIETYLGVPTSTAAMSVSSIYAAPVVAEDSLCIAISQSGRSPDLLATVEAHRKAGAYVVALVNDETSPLAALADELLPLCAGPEKSVAATKSYIASLGGLAAIVAAWSGDEALTDGLRDLPAQLNAAWSLDWSPALPVLQSARNLFVIGRGYGFAVAQEAALKLKETCALHAEAFSSAEVKHGPMAIINDGFPIIGFATSDVAGDGVREAAQEFASRGASVLLANVEAVSGTTPLPALASHPALEPILQIQSFYCLANSLSVARGLDPDTPPHLNKVTKTV
ncbi:SIS domain-containing protein [Asticcacaulis taihuensis]|uniref:Glucosamine--fructose-6-phosphate aminotransferase (Isomerizing) n=1 Tax=Asticcacaulis taihuensis TaxID=260084 RepID=A0A1G4QEV7_9CAUL|nr:SIS domain-containing protein [Asticcacaulis taihuensis]SCW42639.1 glucosamine--fructose-6-phosphate aminotransferase (isomerizing) [Asticcacaulis taihuensis]